MSILKLNPLQADILGNAATASKLQTSRTITLTGDITGSTSFDGSANTSLQTSYLPYSIGTTAPENIRVLWIDTTDDYSIIKYHNGTTWVACGAAWQ